jgi:hypothetical protein
MARSFGRTAGDPAASQAQQTAPHTLDKRKSLSPAYLFLLAVVIPWNFGLGTVGLSPLRLVLLVNGHTLLRALAGGGRPGE